MSKQKKENNFGHYTIREMVANKINKSFFLADIQREYSWDEERVEKLFDSILKGYPIGTCLALKQKEQDESNLYTFIREVEKDKCVGEKRDKTIISNIKEFYSVLDGQQRLTAIYIGTQGSYKVWHGRGRKKQNQSPPARELYFSPKKRKSKNKEAMPEVFKFFSSDDIKPQERDWFKVKDILNIVKVRGNDKVEKWCAANGIKNSDERKSIENLYVALTEKKIISIFEISLAFEPEAAVDIFMRLNGGGIPLKKTDLLFAIAINNWSDGREKIDELIESIRVGASFKGYWDTIDRDFILKASLYLTNQSVSTKVNDLKTGVNYEIIKEEWDDIETSIKDTLLQLMENGHSSESILSKNAILPIAFYYYLNKKNWRNSFTELNKLFIVSQLNGLFVSSTNQTIVDLRDAMREFDGKQFCFKDYVDVLKNNKGNYDLNCDESTVESWVKGDGENNPYEKGKDTFFIFCFLPEYRDKRKYVNEQDHLHPYSTFDNPEVKKYLIDKGKTEQEVESWKTCRDFIGNIWLLSGKKNRKKSKNALAGWLKDNPEIKIVYDPKEEIEKDIRFKKGDNPYDIKYFDVFMEKRNELLIEAISQILL